MLKIEVFVWVIVNWLVEINFCSVHDLKNFKKEPSYFKNPER